MLSKKWLIVLKDNMAVTTLLKGFALVVTHISGSHVRQNVGF